ncbi:reverse transcriptase domain-containing protein [Tanacetum coccineum]
MLLAQTKEAGVVLNDEQHDFLADNLDETDDYCDDEAITNEIFMINLSPVGSINDDMVEPRYDSYILSKAADRVVAPTPGSAITILETANGFTIKGSSNFDIDKIMARMDAMTMKMDAQYKEFQSRSKQPNLDYNDDDTPMSYEKEGKFMQTFHRTRFYNDYHDRDSNRDNWCSNKRNNYNRDNYQSNSDDKPNLKKQLSDFIKSQHSTNSFVKDTFMDLKTKLEATTKNHQASIENLEAKFDIFTDKQSARPSRSLPSNTQPNPKGSSSKPYQPPQVRNEQVNVVFMRSGMPNYGKFLKELVSNKHKLEQILAAFLSDESSALIQNKVPPKLGNPRSFLIPCNFNKAFSCDSLADLGASINLMPYSLYAKLSLKTLKPTKRSVRLADRSFQYPVGIAENMLVEVGKFTFLVDFVSLEMEEDSKVPLILGRPFLHTADAVIRDKKKKLNLGVGTERMTFHMDSTMKHSYSNDDTCFSIDVIDEILEEDFDALLDEEPPTDLELKPLPDNLEYAFLEEPSFLPAIISSQLSEENRNKLVSLLKNHKQAFASKTTNIPGIYLSIIARPLTKLLEKDTPFEFNDECHKAFNSLKEKLTCTPVIVSPNWNLLFELMCDAIDFAVGAVLGQKDGKHFHPIYFASKTLNVAQQKYTVTEKELMAVVFAFDKCRPYMILSKRIVYTDHSALRHLFKKQDAKPRLIRWILLLQEFDIEIKDKKGAENVAADHLSRIENDETSDDSDVDDNFLGENLMEITTNDTPWFVDFANYLVGDVIPKGMTYQQKKKIILRPQKPLLGRSLPFQSMFTRYD